MMRYLTAFMSNVNKITTVAGGSSNAVFPNTKLGLESLRIYVNNFTIFGEEIKSGNAGLYVADGEDPIDLPFDMNLNYIDLKNAKKLDARSLERAISIMSKYEPYDIINASDHIDLRTGKESESLHASRLNHSREQLISILSSIAVTIGPVVSSEKELRSDSAMANQVIITRPITFYRVPTEEALAIIADNWDDTMKFFYNDSSTDEEGEFGLGGDWWKSQNEAIYKIADSITEDI